MRVLVAGLVVSCALACEPAPEYDILIQGGRVIDGTGSSARDADVAIQNGIIADIGELDAARAKRVIDAEGRVVTPGFIDMMGGSTLPLLRDPVTAESKLRQGITTMMAGEGLSLAPQNDRTFAELDLAELPHRWTRFAEYLRILEDNGVALNVVHNVGAAQVRRIVLGDEDVAPSEAQLEEMKSLIAQAMDDGAVGISSSLIYPPGAYATTEELTELAKAAASKGGVYFTHMRNESNRVLEAIDEALVVGRGAAIPVHIYHLKAAGEENWPLMEQALARIQNAIDEGMDVTADVYPYIRNGIGLGSFLHPRHYARGEEAFIATLGDNSVRARLREEVEETSDWENWYRHVGNDWNNVLITRVGRETAPELVGLSVQEVGDKLGVDAWDAFFDLVAQGSCGVAPKSMNEEQKHLAMQADFMCFDNDASPTNPTTVASSHPRAFGAFPLEDAIRKLTSLPARIVFHWDRVRSCKRRDRDRTW